MAYQLFRSNLVGDGQGQHVRIIIEVTGPPGDFTELGRLTRREMAAGLETDIAKAAASFGVVLTDANPK